ncbi:Uncharacterised protein [Mycobacteroides abscessus subsp. massiliense]|nr:Uncharacterised protein [Mycobacteroides abscessus subsp. massiliense]
MFGHRGQVGGGREWFEVLGGFVGPGCLRPEVETVGEEDGVELGSLGRLRGGDQGVELVGRAVLHAG